MTKSLVMKSDGEDLFLLLDGVRIAQRGRPDTRQARTWVSLEPGYTVLSPPDLSEIIVEHHGVRIH